MKASEIIDTLTGYDELALESVAGKPYELLSPSLLVRALAALVMTREDEKLTIQAAYSKVLSMKQEELQAWYADRDLDEEDEVFEDEPVTESGKDDSETESELLSSPPSSSGPA